MTRAVFVDACFWIALFQKNSSLHEIAKKLGNYLEGRVVTSEMVLVEFLTSFAGYSEQMKTQIYLFVRKLQESENVEIVPQTSDLFEEAFNLLENRKDKTWSLTDCASFLIMEHQGMQEALTEDVHFEQNNYRALMRAS
ncbi:MAG: type II toxin-antitoxin system VapC family toxin [Alphaproteobacteria bacterium]|nr:type II toxin-antitoxin system VapC family toxin [Alphaproteobacteria bacterium]QQS58378.1 MAG: type II toxin-antitoxin system VapC family toxin [Alphaproteobacteria bacterium]